MAILSCKLPTAKEEGLNCGKEGGAVAILSCKSPTAKEEGGAELCCIWQGGRGCG